MILSGLGLQQRDESSKVLQITVGGQQALAGFILYKEVLLPLPVTKIFADVSKLCGPFAKNTSHLQRVRPDRQRE
jgi:hypothetical protein